ncbi:hypothetical protein [Bradyrhizobium sp. CCBAU 51753]|uniref:hypothetical protein n=1 Tax=Bradyrhizobium sp. CCBAU 51753 TaxID=1325100 RepID=UPI00188C59FE|nr:hypothetical protein [Bradyrhizobium sp. CCBAU 51753]QOZ25310.1 hypothetical protein XH93_18215 [Bradyrhizobium sp. CCBAU 51753]
MPDQAAPPSFDDMAVAITLAATKVRLDFEQMELLSHRVGLSPMGTTLALAELQKTLDHLAAAHRFLKESAAAETEIRAVAARKKMGSWFSRIPKVAAL